jgi:type II secretory pathway component PulL
MNSKVKSYDQQMLEIYKEVFPNATKVVDPYNELKAKLAGEKKKSNFAASNAGNIRVIDLLNDISKTIDQSVNVELERLVLGSDDLKISGSADTYATVDAMKTRLEKISYFKTVVITSTTGDQSDKIVRFKLTIEFKGAE